MALRDSEFWAPEPIWRGRTAILLGGGPSLRGADLDRLKRPQARGVRIIAINSLVLAAPFADMLYFTDSHWFDQHKIIVAEFHARGGYVVTVSRAAKGSMPDAILRLDQEHRADFPPPWAKKISYGRSSGHIAVSLAVSLGCARIILLGYDMRTIDGRSHSHDDYDRIQTPELYSNDFIPQFDGWGKAARDRGVDIVNCTIGSALKEFRSSMLYAELPPEGRCDLL